MLERTKEHGGPAAVRRPRWGSTAGLSVLGVLAAAAVVAGTIASASAAKAGAAPTCGSQPVTMNAYIETGFPLPIELTKEFTRQYPNVKWNIR